MSKLRQADRELGKGLTVKELCRSIDVSEQTYYRCQRLRKIIADQRIDMEIMKEADLPPFSAPT